MSYKGIEDKLKELIAIMGGAPGGGLAASDLNIEALTKDLQVDVASLPPLSNVDVNNLNLSYNPDGTVSTIIYRNVGNTMLWTLTFNYTQGILTNITKS